MQPPRTARLLPLIFPLLAAVGVLLAVLFAAESTPTAALDLRFDRAAAAQIAADFLRGRGEDPAERWSTVSYQLSGDAQSYLLREAGRETLNQRAEADLDLGHWRVRFWRPLDPDEWAVLISARSGRVLGYHHTIRGEEPGAALPVAAAQRLAEAALPVPVAGLSLVEQTSEAQPDRVDHSFTWERNDLRDGEARYRYSVRVQGDRVDGLAEYYWLPDSWWREGAWQGRRGALLSTVGWTLTYALTALIGLTWLLIAGSGRLRRRWAATLFLAVLVVGVLVMLNSLPIDLANYNVNESLPAYLLRQFTGYLSQLLTISATIVLAGMAGEALVWERTGGALSMSAALTRRGLLSRPVVQALLVGGLVGVFQLGFVSAFYALGGRWFGVWSPVTALYDDTLSTPFPALYALALGLLPAVGEELLFRLGGITVLTRWTGKPRLAIVLTAIVWASLHSTYPQRPFFIRMLELSIIGVIFGILFVRYGVLASMAAHFTYNASLYVPLFWGGSVLYLISGIVAAGAVALLLIPALLRRLRGLPLEPDAALAVPLPAALDPPPAAAAGFAAGYPWRRLLAGGLLALVALALAGWNLAPPLGRPDKPAEALTRAAAVSQQLGIDLTGLHGSIQAVADWVDLDLVYLYDTFGRDSQGASQAAAIVGQGHSRAWMARWSAWDRTDSWQIDLGPTGEALAYRLSIPEDAPGATITLTAAQALATAAISDQIDLAEYELLDAGSVTRSARTDHAFTWQTRAPVAGEAYRRVDVEVAGDRVSALTPSMYTPPAYRRERDQTTIANSIIDTIQGGLTGLPTLLLPLIGLVGVLRRQVSVKPWALLGLLGGVIWLLLGIGRLNHAQISEIPRLILGVCWALADAVLNGGELALLGAGAATAWSAGSAAIARGARPALASLEAQAAALVSGWPTLRPGPGGATYRFQAHLLGWLLVPLGLLFVNLRGWPAPRPGLFAATSPINAAAPAFDAVGRALLSATTTSLLLAGSWGGLVWVLRRRGWAPDGRWRGLPLAITALGLLLAAINLREPAELALALVAWPAAVWLGANLRGNLLAMWWALVVVRVLPAALALAGTYINGGTLRYFLEGGALLLLLAASLGWAGGRGIEQRDLLDAAPTDGAPVV